METKKNFKVGKFPATDSKSGNIKKEEDEKSEEDDCYEIDPLDFTKKLLLEVSDNGDHNEVVIVAAKGPVALRDFPHPRHLCGNLSFNSTLHEKHCKQCYCIVCQVPAPAPSGGMELVHTAMSQRGPTHRLTCDFPREEHYLVKS